MKPRYKRVMLKLTGELLMGKLDFGIDMVAVERLADELIEISNSKVEIVIEMGGGNIYRWRQAQKGVIRDVADMMGILGSCMNALNLKEAFGKKKEVSVFTPIYMPYVIQYYIPALSRQALDAGKIVIIGGGTGQQFFTTDTGAVLHALQNDCQVVLKGSKVDGIYDSDPEKNPQAKKFDQITFDEVLARRLSVMDMTAFALCRDNNLPIIVFDAMKPGNIKRVIMGEKLGTLVK